MTEPIVPSEPKINLNLIPKEEFEKAKKEAEVLKSERDEAKMQLLDPSYLEFLESKKKVTEKVVNAASTLPASDLKMLQDELNSLKREIQVNKDVVSQIWYERELETTRKMYPDFDTYKESIQKILEASKGEKTYKEAYILAKAMEEESKGATTSKTPPSTFSTEKPTTTVPASTLEPRKAKTVAEANQATLNDLKSKYPNLGDTI